MEITVEHRPSYALAIVKLAAEETVLAEAGSMVSMDSHVRIKTTVGDEGDGMMKGLMKGLKRMVAGESFFQNRYTADGAPGEVTFAPILQGDIDVHHLTQDTFYLQSSAFVASDDRIKIDAKWGGAKTFFGGEGLVMLKATGTGPIAFNSFGAIRELDIDGSYTVGTGHIVAFEETLDFSISKFGGGWKSFLLGGEGLVCRFSGRGKLWIQTRNSAEFGSLIGGKLPPREH